MEIDIDKDVWGTFLGWLHFHEWDIAENIKDFGDLKEFYKEALGKAPERGSSFRDFE